MEAVITDIERLNIDPENGAEEIIQNCVVILSTPKGSVPGDRRFGTDSRSLDKPLQIARTLIVADVIDAISTFEPRASVKDIRFIEDNLAGKLTPVITLEIENYER